jgi:hypothetical protein
MSWAVSADIGRFPSYWISQTQAWLGQDAGLDLGRFPPIVWKTRVSMYMPPAAMIEATIAPKGPVAGPDVRGRENMPAPTIDPTTMLARTSGESFCGASVAMMVFQLRHVTGTVQLGSSLNYDVQTAVT